MKYRATPSTRAPAPWRGIALGEMAGVVALGFLLAHIAIKFAGG